MGEFNKRHLDLITYSSICHSIIKNVFVLSFFFLFYFFFLFNFIFLQLTHFLIILPINQQIIKYIDSTFSRFYFTFH